MTDLFHANRTGPGIAADTRIRWMQIAWLLFGLGLLALSLKPEINSDGNVRFDDLTRMANGLRPQQKYSALQPFMALPVYALGGLLGNARQFVAYFNLGLFALLLLALWRWLAGEEARFASLLLLVAASMFPVHLRNFYGEVFTCAFCVIGLLVAERRPGLGGTLLAIGAANTPATLPALALALVFYVFKTKKFAILVALPLATALLIFDNLLKSGAPI